MSWEVDPETQAARWHWERLLALTEPQPGWRLLKIVANGEQGSPTRKELVRLAVADPTQVNSDGAALQSFWADANRLPLANNTFELVSCRRPAFSLPQLPELLGSIRRALRPGGVLVLSDVVVPGTHLRGKKAHRQRQAGVYINTVAKLRRPDHRPWLNLSQWQQQFYEVGLQIVARESAAVEWEFGDWVARGQAPDVDRVRLQAMLLQAPVAAASYLAPRREHGRLLFRLQEILFVVRVA